VVHGRAQQTSLQGKEGLEIQETKPSVAKTASAANALPYCSTTQAAAGSRRGNQGRAAKKAHKVLRKHGAANKSGVVSTWGEMESHLGLADD
jgi:hypothetical protein